MTWLYNTGINIYHAGIYLASPFVPKARKFSLGRKHALAKLQDHLRKIDRVVVWFHCASLGEFEQGKPLMKKLKKADPNVFLLVTFFSPSGYEQEKNSEIADYCCYLPKDATDNARSFLETVKPQFIVFVKNEFWYHYLNQAYKKGIPVFCISAVFSKDQLFFKWYGKWFRNLLHFYDHIAVQNRESKELLHQIGICHCSVTGDTRFDRVSSIARKLIDLPVVKAFKENAFLIIAGSCWEREEDLCIHLLKEFPDRLKVVFAPHDISSDRMQSLKQRMPVSCALYSEATQAKINTSQALIIDNIGLLSSLYAYADIAFVGGGFQGALHNILEPAAHGKLVVFGPQVEKFWEAESLINAGGAISIDDEKSLVKEVQFFLENPGELERRSTLGKEYITHHEGATEATWQIIDQRVNHK